MPYRQSQLERDDPLDALAHGDSAASVDAWLNVVSRLMRLPEKSRQEIRSELREHLRERVRDLLLAGGACCDERDALRTAMDELGETAQLARRFEAANQPRTRRLVMNSMLALIGVGGLAAGVMTLTNPAPSPGTMMAKFEAGETVAAPPSESLQAIKCDLQSEATLRDAIESVVKNANVGLMIDWGDLEQQGIAVADPLGLSFHDMPAPKALTLIAQAGGANSAILDWRMRENNLIEFGMRNELDRREVELVTYDISESVARIAATYTDDQAAASQQVMELLTTMVEPDNWRDNGGDLAHMKFVGGRLFVQAPTRMHGKVKWILDQLPHGQNPPQANAGEGERGDGVPILSDVPIVGNFFRHGPVATLMNPGDTVTVSIFELYQPNTWATSTRRIDEAGMYRVSEIGEVRAAGKSIDEFSKDVARQLQTKVLGGVAPKVDVVLENSATAR